VKKRNILITAALPYANGDLHLGHMLEFIQTDIWFLYHKQIGSNCFFISASDTHGTPIMLKSLSKNILPDLLINKYEISHKHDILNFNIKYDNFYTTHSYENEILSRKLFYRLFENNYIFNKNVIQFYDDVKNFFLPDRYIKGSCPKCKTNDQYGDVCESCSYRYDAIDLINPISVISNTKPIKKNSVHYFLNLKKFEKFLNAWSYKNLSQNEIKNKLNDWFKIGIKNWDISRDNPYFGFTIPGEYNKFFYVWLDAPVGYISSFQNFFINKYLFFNCLKKENNFELYHFIGKDILYFHTLFWPAVLHGTFLKTPNNIFVHGFLTINGKKMSKSNNTFITAKNFYEKFEPEYLRYYFASKLNDNVVDLDFNFNDFIDKINSELIGNFMNIFIRCSKFIIKNHNSKLSNNIIDTSLFLEYLNLKNICILLYEKRQYSKIISHIMKHANKINLYIDKEKPWYLVKNKNTYKRAQDVCSMCINLFLILLFCIKPIIPKISNIIEKLLNVNCSSIFNNEKPILNIKIKNYKYILRKIKEINL